MICALILDLGQSQDLMARNLALGRVLAAYPLMAAKETRQIQRIYIATATPEVKAIARQYSAIILDPPAQAKTWTDEFRHALGAILAELKTESQTLDLLALMFSHVPTVNGGLINSAIDVLRDKPDAQWALSVSEYNHFHPLDALRETTDGMLRPYLDSPATIVQAGPVWYPDWGVSIGRAHALQAWIPDKQPRPWGGKKIAAIKQQGGMHVEHSWQIPAAEAWLKNHGLGDAAPTLQAKLQPQAQIRPERR